MAEETIPAVEEEDFTPPSAVESDDDDLSFLNNSSLEDGDVEPVVEEVDETTKPAVEDTPSPEPGDKAPEGPAAQPTPAPEPAKPEPPTPEPKPAAEPQPAAPQRSREEIRTEAVKQLSERYQFSQEEAEILGPEAAKVFSDGIGRVLFDVYENVGRMMREQLPVMVRNVNQQDTVIKQKEETFFSEYPELNKSEWRKEITNLAKTLRTLDKSKSEDEFRRELATHARIKFKIPFDVQTGKLIEQNPAPVTPASTPSLATTRTPAGVANPPSAVPVKKNLFEELADDDF